MNRDKMKRRCIAFVALLFTLHASTEKCECKNSSSSSSTPPPNPTLSVKNQYGITVAYEVWTGSNLEYREGIVLGDNLSKVASSLALTNGSTSAGTTISYDGAFILVIGVNDPPNYIYLTSQKVLNFQTSRTLTIDANGIIN